jgi:hypothetical protein
MRKCFAAILSLSAAAAAALSSSNLVQLLKSVFVHRPTVEPGACSDCGAECMVVMMVQLLQQPAAAQLSSGQVKQLLSSAICWNSSLGLHECCASSIAEQISRGMLLQLLQQAAEQVRHAITETLCGLPAAQHISSEEFTQLLVGSAVVDDRCAYHLCKMPAAGHLSMHQLQLVLQASMTRRNYGCTRFMIKWLTGQQLSYEAVAELLVSSLTRESHCSEQR